MLTDKAATCNIKRNAIRGFQKETRGHMLLVALIPRYKKSTRERKEERVVIQRNNRAKKKNIENKRELRVTASDFLRKIRRNRRNLAELNFLSLFSYFLLSIGMYWMAKMSFVIVLSHIMN